MFNFGPSTRKWTYPKDELKDESSKKWEDKIVILTKDSDYFIDEEGIMWQNFMAAAYPDSIEWKGNTEPKAGTIAKILYGFIEDSLFAITMDGKPFAVNADSVMEIDPEDMEEDGTYTGTIIVKDEIRSGTFATSYGMPKFNGEFGKKLIDSVIPEEIAFKLIEENMTNIKYAGITFVLMETMVQLIGDEGPLLVFDKRTKKAIFKAPDNAFIDAITVKLMQ